MGFLRRLLGGSETEAGDNAGAEGGSETEAGDTSAAEPAAVDAEERAHELELARAEQDRLDELQQRQLRYAKYAWQPPAQGGERRADDADAGADREPG